MAAVVALAALVGLAPDPAAAQSTSWTTQLLVPPFASSFVSEWERNPQNLTLGVTYLGTAPAEYRIEGTLTGATRGTIARATSPFFTVEAGPVTDLYTGDDLLDWDVRVLEATAEDAWRSGVIPDDDYEICVRLVTPGGVQLNESCANFLVELPEAPQLLFPADGDGVSVFQPTFQWTPVVLREQLGIEYQVTIVERYPGQNPVVAVDANLPVFEETVGEAPLLVYPIDAIPLEPGREYVWQVEVLDGFGDPLVPEGLFSPPQRFTTAETDAFGRRLTPDGGLPETLPLVPGLATLTDLEGVEVEPTPDGWLLNGQAWMDLDGPYGVRGRVRLEDLLLDDYGGFLSPTEGRVVARLESELPVPADAPVTVGDLVYTPEDGLTATASLALPGGTSVPLEGELQVTQGGLYGELSAGSPEWEPGGQEIWSGGSDPVEVALRYVRVSFPDGTTTAGGTASLFGGRAVCTELSAVVSSGGSWSVEPLCVPEVGAEFRSESELLAVQVGVTSGPITVDLQTGTVEYDLATRSRVELAPSAGNCSLSFTVVAASGAPVRTEDVIRRCDAASASLDAGWILLRLSGLELDALGYDPGDGFSLAASVDIEPSLPTLPTLTLPALEDVEITEDGLRLPPVALSTERPGVDLAGYGLTALSVSLPAVELSWADWRAATPGGFRIDFTADLSLPGLGATAPGCLTAAAPVVSGGVIQQGVLQLDISGTTGLGADCRIDIVEGMTLAFGGFAGPLEVALESGTGPSVELTRPLGVTGSLLLEDPFVCPATGAALELDGTLDIYPDGTIGGGAATAVEACPLRVAGVDLILQPGSVRVDRGRDPAVVALSAGVTARSAEGESPVQANGDLTVDLATGEILDGEARLGGPLALSLPADDPVFTFTLDAAVLTADGLSVDGRHQVRFPDGGAMGVTFDQVTVSSGTGEITAGTVYFDSEFALQGGITEEGDVDWAAVSAGSDFGLDSGFRVYLPARVALTDEGLGVEGQAGAELAYDGRTFGTGEGVGTEGTESEEGGDGTSDSQGTTLAGVFRDDFVLGLSPVTVTRGLLDLEVDARRIAWVDPAGFHPDFLAFGAALLPDRLPLPTEEVAYLELRDDQGNLRVQEDDTGAGLRVFTDPGRPLPLVLPSLDVDGTGAPRVMVSVDLTLDSQGGLSVRSGQIVALVDPASQPDMDLSRAGIPFRVRELSYADSQGQGYVWSLLGDPVILGEPVVGGSVVLALGEPPSPGASPRLAGLVDVPYSGEIELVESSTALRFTHQRMTGGFDVALDDGSGTWSLALEGGLLLALDGGGGLDVGATLEASPSGVSFTALDVDPQAPPFYFDAGSLDLGVSDLTIPTLAWDETSGWDFEIEFDLAFRFPTLDSLESATVPDIRLTPDGMTLPDMSFTGFDGNFELDGFSVEPLALRIPSVTLDPFGPGIQAAWNPSFDLSVSLGDDGQARWPALADFELTVLDAGWSPDGLTGTIEARTLLQPIDLDFGTAELGLSLDRFGGALRVDGGVQVVDVQVGGEIRLPETLSCPASPDPVLATPSTDLELFGDGGFGGRVENASLNCPLQLGPLQVGLTDADLVFAFVGDVQAVNLFTDATLNLPGVTAGSTVNASGTLDVALVEPEIIGGSIAVTQPFRWDVPSGDPFLSFEVNQAVLDTRGFVLDGSGSVLPGAGGVGPQVTFSGLTFDVNGDVVAGSASVQSGLALDGALVGSTLDWSLADPTLTLGGADGFRMSLQGGATLSASGLALDGTASAELNFNDSTFAALDVDFSQGFTLAARDARVTAGRADFALGQTDVAYVTPQGFFPGDIFGVLPLPDRIPLPTEDVAYLQVRDPSTGQPVVETATAADGLTLSTRSGESVDLVLPSLPDAGGNPTVVPVQFSVTANGSSFALVSGSIEAQTSQLDGLFDLDHLGVPVTVTRVAYDSRTPSGPVLDARLGLPASLNGLDVQFTDLAVTGSGLQGEARVGTLDPAAGASPPAVADVTLGALDFRVDGALVRFGSSPGATLEGSFASDFFQDDAGTAPDIDYTASVSAAGDLSVSVDLSSLPDGKLPIGQALFELVAVNQTGPVTVTADDQEFTLGFSGVLTLPELAPDFALTVDGLSVGSGGVALAGAGANMGPQSFELFGADFDLRDTAAGPGLGLGLEGNVLLLEMNGDVDFYGQTLAFQGLELGSDGRVDMAGASLTGGPVDLIPGSVVLQRLSIANSALRADLAIDLPAPFDGTGTQQASFSVAADGSVSGGANVALIDETPGLGGSRTQVDGLLATAHLRYLGLRLDASAANPGTVEAVGDLYLAGDSGNRISLGSRENNTVDPGLSLGFDGSVSWGGVTLSRNFDFDFDMLSLTVENVTVASSSDREVVVGFGGRLTVDVDVVSGGLGFSGLEVGSDLSLSTDNASVRDGSLTIAGVVGVSLRNFEYSSTATTITDIPAGAMPTGGSTQPVDGTESLRVSSVLRFGGTLSLATEVGGSTLFSGGVEDFLFYKTPVSEGARTNIVVRQAGFDIPGVAMEADLRYEELAGGFKMLLGGTGQFGSQQVGFVGNFESSDAGPIRAGLFMMSTSRIELIPVLLAIEGVGGGFFYNAEPETCQLVRSVSGVGDYSQGGNACDDTGRFTGFLYAEAVIVERSLARAATLITISENRFQLDGAVALLYPGGGNPANAPIGGTVNLTVGFGKAFAEGGVTIDVDYAPLISGKDGESVGELGFYVYGADEWGVFGKVSVEVLTIMDGQIEVFVGPPGFYIEGGVQVGVDFGFLSAEAYANAALWLVDQSWGAYLNVGVSAEIAEGAVSASADLVGAIVKGNSGPVSGMLVFFSAELQGCIIGLCASAAVHAEWENGELEVDWGRGGRFEDVLAEARAAKARFDAEKDDLRDRIATSQLVSNLALDPSELAAIYQQIQESDQAYQTLFQARGAEFNLWPRSIDPVDLDGFRTAERRYLDDYLSILRQGGSPRKTMVAPTLESLYTETQTRAQALAQNTNAVYGKLDQALTDVQELEEYAGLPALGPSPVQNVSFGPPVVDTASDGSLGMTSGPGFELDQGAADALTSELSARQEDVAAYAREVGDRIRQVEAGVAWLDQLLLDTASTAPLGYAEDYGELLETVQRQYAFHGDLLLRQQDWLRERSTFLAQRWSNEGRSRLTDLKTAVISSNMANPDTLLESLILSRAQALDDLSGTTTLARDFISGRAETEAELGQATTTQALKESADTLGAQLWYGLAIQGMAVADSIAGVEFDSIRSRFDRELMDRWLEHTRLTESLDRAMMARAEMTGSLYDLYAEYRRVFPDLQAVTSNLTLEDLATSPDQLSALERARTFQQAFSLFQRQNELADQLQVPSVDIVQVTSRNAGYIAEETFNLVASHPTGIHEYLFNALQGHMWGVSGANLMQSNGSRSTRTRWVLTPGRGTTSQPWTLRAGVRGGAGFLGLKRAEFTTRFEGSGSTGPGSAQTSYQDLDTSAPGRPRVFLPPDSARGDTDYWTPDTERIRGVNWRSSDSQSGIARYEYAMGTLTDTTLVRGWTDVGGRSVIDLTNLALDPIVPAPVTGTVATLEGENNTFTLTASQVEPVSLERPGYHVFVRATNGRGLVSGVGASNPIRIDQTRPRFPDDARITQPLVLAPLQMTFYTLGTSSTGDPIFDAAQPVCAPPAQTGSYVVYPLQWNMTTLDPAQTPERTFTIPRALDLGSGVAQYAWKISGGVEDPDSVPGWSFFPANREELTVTGAPLVFGDSLTLSVVAVDQAGLFSEPIHYEFTVPDPTDPVGASFCAGIGSTARSVRMRISDPGQDPETGVVAWDYRIRRDDGTIIRDFPATPDSTALTQAQTVSTPDLSVGDGTRLYAEIRLHNGDGRTTITASGPLEIDLTPPPTPSLYSAAATNSGDVTSMTVQYRTGYGGDFTHGWALIRVGSTSPAARGTLPDTWGGQRTETLDVQSATGGALPPGNYRFVLHTTSSTGLTSRNVSLDLAIQ